MTFEEVLNLEKEVLSGLLAKPELLINLPDGFNKDSFISNAPKEIFLEICNYFYNDSDKDNEFFVYISARCFKYMNYWLPLPAQHVSDNLWYSSVKKLLNYSFEVKLKKLGSNIVELADDNELLQKEKIEKITNLILEVNAPTKSKIKDIETSGSELITSLRDKKDCPIKTGFKDLDKIINLTNGGLHIIAARSSVGKSALAFQIGYNVSNSEPVLIFSLEMSSDQIISRYCSANLKINLMNITSRNLGSHDIDKMENYIKSIHDKKLYINDNGSINIEGIFNSGKQAKLKQDIKLIIVDYLQLAAKKSRGKNREQEISETSRGLKLLARELNIPVIALCQINRSIEMEADKRPKLHHLRESGAIEQDADSVIMLYNDDLYIKDEPKNIIEVIIRKQRNGALGTEFLKWNKHYVCFEDIKLNNKSDTIDWLN